MTMTTQDFIEQLRQETGVPYIDVICKEKHETIFRYASGEGVTGKELLHMYSCSKVITAVAAFIGALLGVSSIQYHSKEEER